MIICLAGVLSERELEHLGESLARLEFVDGAATAGWHARQVKRNRQLRSGPGTGALQDMIEAALRRHPAAQHLFFLQRWRACP